MSSRATAPCGSAAGLGASGANGAAGRSCSATRSPDACGTIPPLGGFPRAAPRAAPSLLLAQPLNLIDGAHCSWSPRDIQQLEGGGIRELRAVPSVSFTINTPVTGHLRRYQNRCSHASVLRHHTHRRSKELSQKQFETAQLTLHFVTTICHLFMTVRWQLRGAEPCFFPAPRASRHVAVPEIRKFPEIPLHWVPHSVQNCGANLK